MLTLSSSQSLLGQKPLLLSSQVIHAWNKSRQFKKTCKHICLLLILKKILNFVCLICRPSSIKRWFSQCSSQSILWMAAFYQSCRTALCKSILRTCRRHSEVETLRVGSPMMMMTVTPSRSPVAFGGGLHNLSITCIKAEQQVSPEYRVWGINGGPEESVHVSISCIKVNPLVPRNRWWTCPIMKTWISPM